MSRAAVSEGPPGGKGMIHRIGLDGKSPAASGEPCARTGRHPKIAAYSVIVRTRFITRSSWIERLRNKLFPQDPLDKAGLPKTTLNIF
jgi:hypothetical protein